MLKLLQKELPKLWTDDLYSAQFKADPCPYKDFDHALKHAIKAAVAMQNMVEEADHKGVAAFFPPADVRKYVADLVISALRLAIKDPSGAFDLEAAVIERIETKMKVRLENDVFVSCFCGRPREWGPCPSHGWENK